MKTIYPHLVFIIVTILIDLIWLVGARKWHEVNLAKVQKSPLQLNYKYAPLFYLVASIAFATFIIPLSKDKSYGKIALYGAILGLALYGSFDFTNITIFKDYDLAYAVSDVAWGTFALSLASVLTIMILKKLNVY